MPWSSVTPAPALAFALALTAPSGPAAQPRPSIAIVRAAFDDAACTSPAAARACVVTIEADGPLPEPSSGAAKNPDRVYLDFAGIRAETSGQPRQSGSRVGVRVAIHSAAPLVTRVVIDLAAAAPYTVDVSQRAQGRVRVQFGQSDTAAASAPSAPRQSTASAPRSAAPASPSGAPAKSSTRARSAYGETIDVVFDALERMRADLTLLDRRALPSADSLRTHSMQLTAARKALVVAKPPAAFASGHAQLVSACSLAAMAFDGAAADGAAGVTPQTASAAAGALILLEHAHAALAAVR